MNVEASDARATAWRPEDAEVRDWVDGMRRHVDQGPEIYRPGAFWADLLERNLEMLRADGIRAFKRTVSNNYYNWLVVSWTDPQLRRAIARWLRRPRAAPLR